MGIINEGVPTEGGSLISVYANYTFIYYSVNIAESTPIVLINDTPAVSLDSSTSASIQVDFTLRSDVASATCELSGTSGPLDCEPYILLPS